MKPAFHPSHTPWKSLRGFPHSHGYGDGCYIFQDRQTPPKTRNQSHSHRKGLVNHVPGLKRKGCTGTLTVDLNKNGNWNTVVSISGEKRPGGRGSSS